jgi:hypothetical protein
MWRKPLTLQPAVESDRGVAGDGGSVDGGDAGVVRETVVRVAVQFGKVARGTV